MQFSSTAIIKARSWCEFSLFGALVVSLVAPQYRGLIDFVALASYSKCEAIDVSMLNVEHDYR